MPLGIVVDINELDTSNLLTLIGFAGTIAGLIFAARQFAASRRATQGQFLLELNDHFRHFDAIYRSLYENRKRASTSPPWKPPDDDWTAVAQYMGLFERCMVLIDNGVLNISTFERLYGYRFRDLVRVETIRQRFFKDLQTAGGWSDFLKLWSKLDDQEFKRTGKAPEPRRPFFTSENSPAAATAA